MAFLRVDFYSEALGSGTGMNVLLPEAAQGIGFDASAGTGALPVLYLLHGLSDDHTAWMRRTSLERYAASRRLAVVMPCGGRSFYTNEAHGGRYWDFISEELPRAVQSFFPVSRRREDTFAAGLSMGGYGALKLALRHPDRYAAGQFFRRGGRGAGRLIARFPRHFPGRFVRHGFRRARTGARHGKRSVRAA